MHADAPLSLIGYSGYQARKRARERPLLGDSGKAAFRVRFADRERRYVRKAGVTTVRRLEAFDSWKRHKAAG